MGMAGNRGRGKTDADLVMIGCEGLAACRI